jgi:hypothetical protein
MPGDQWPLAFDMLEALAALAEFRALDDGAPLLLLPVRLETKYVMEPAPGELRIRIFPEPVHVDAGADGKPSRAALLPQRWVVLGYHGSDLLFAEVSRPVAENLVTSLDPSDASWEVVDSGLHVSPELAWMFDYTRAVDVGMAVTIPLGDGDRLLAEVSTLLVVGVDASMSADEATGALTRILERHQRDAGLAFVPQGTPTNNTAGAPSGWTSAGPEPTPGAKPTEPTRPPNRLPRVPLPGMPGSPDSNAARFSRLLGLAPNVVDGIAFGDERERAHSRAMNTVLYQALFGRFVTSLLSVAGERQPDEITAAWRDWLIDHVTGGAPVPTVRVGAQPYGILPVRPLGPSDRETAAGNVEATVQYLRAAWRAAVPNVPLLDPDATDLAGDPADPLDALPAVLASQPHPARVFTRTFMGDGEDWRFLFESTRMYATALLAIELNLPFLWDLYQPAVARHGPFADIHDQLAFWDSMHGVIDDAEYGIEDPRPSPETERAMHDQVDSMINLVDNYLSRQDPLEVVGLPVYGGVVGEPLTEIVGGAYVTDSYEWTTPHLVEDPDAPDDQRAAAYLRVLATRVTAPDEPSPFPDNVGAPLLHQLIDGALGQLAEDATASTRALDTLAGLDTVALERLFRESLGLATHRLDAWATSLAAARLDEMRRTRPTGLNIGAFGWVVNLNRGPASDSEGFIHAPSLAHATTAAVLRSAWQAHGHDNAASLAAVALDSSRVRAADWLVQGLRAGQPLGDLLGQRFERSLHDHLLDDQIDDIRQAVLANDPESDATVRDPVDGLRLLDLWRAGSLESYLAAAGALRVRVEDELAALDAVFDALADATLFESTHHLVNGNLDAAAAVLNASTEGTPVLPELRGSRTGRGGTTIEHRVLLVVPDDHVLTASGWVDGLRDRFAPGVERWLRQLLPDPARVGFVAVADDGGQIELDLGGLGLSALDFIDLAGPDPSVVAPALAGLIAAVHHFAVGTEVDLARHGGTTELALDELLLLASELRSALAGARPLGDNDLRAAGAAAAPEPEVRNLLAAFHDCASELASAVGTSRATVDAVALARFGRLAAVADEDGWQRLRTLADEMTAGSTSGLGLDELTARVAALFGTAVTVTPSVPMPAPEGGGLTVDLALADIEAIDDWVGAIGRVRAPVGRLVTASTLAELLGGPAVTWVAGQDRIPDGDGWIAVGPPGDGLGGRTSACAAIPAGEKLVRGASVSGLALDRWSERIPRSDRITGVTFHFDAPNARAPQAWILAVPPDGAPWTLELVVRTLFEVGDWARLRTVQPEDLVSYGHVIPTAFVPGTFRLYPDAEPVS